MPAGYTAWRVGSEIEDRDLVGNVVAVTGRRYDVLLGAYPVGSTPKGPVTSGACIKERPDPTPMGLLVLFIIGILLASALLLVRRAGGKDREATLPT